MMWDSDEQTALGVDAVHGAAYVEALDDYAQDCGRHAPEPWRALLYIGTSDAILWAWLRPRLDYARGTADLHGQVELPGVEDRGISLASHGSTQVGQLLQVARHLFGDESEPTIHLTGLLQRLSDRSYHVLMGALHEYRGHH